MKILNPFHHFDFFQSLHIRSVGWLVITQWSDLKLNLSEIIGAFSDMNFWNSIQDYEDWRGHYFVSNEHQMLHNNLLVIKW